MRMEMVKYYTSNSSNLTHGWLDILLIVYFISLNPYSLKFLVSKISEFTHFYFKLNILQFKHVLEDLIV